MSLYSLKGTTGVGPQLLRATDAALFRRQSMLALVDYEALRLMPSGAKDLDINSRIRNVPDLVENAAAGGMVYDHVGLLSAGNRLVSWANGLTGLEMVSSTGVKRSRTNRVPTSGDWTMVSLFTQQMGLDGYPLMTADTAGFIGAGYTAANALRVWYGAGFYDLTGGSALNDGLPCCIILSRQASGNRLRVWRNGVEIDDRAQAIGAVTDARLMVGGISTGASATGVVDGVIHLVALAAEAGDDGSAFITDCKVMANGRSAAGWPVV